MVQPKLRFPEFNDEWELKKLKDYLIFQNGLNADKEKFGSGTKFISVMDILNNPFITYDVIRGSVEVDTKTLNNYSVEYGDILFQRSSENREDAGKSNVYLDKENTATFGGFVIRGKKKGNYDPAFINALLKSDSVRKEITSKAQGAQHINVGQETLENVKFYVPSLPEQEKIGLVFSEIDSKITAIEKNIESLEEYKKGIMQKIFNQEIRFKDDNGEAFPEWEEKRIGDCFGERNEKANGDEELLSVTIKNGIIKQDELNKKDTSNVDKSKYKKVYIGDIAYNSMRMWQGAEGVSEYDGIVSPAYTILIPQNVNPVFFEYLFKMKFMLNLFQRYSQGITSDTWNLKYPQISILKVKVPHIKEQDKIVDFFTALDKRIEAEYKILEDWKQLKKALIQQMFV